MDKQSNSTAVHKSLGELTGNIVDKLRAARSPALEDIQADMTRLVCLIEVIDDHVYDLPLGTMGDHDVRKLSAAQHLAQIAVHFAKHVDDQLAGLSRRAEA